MGMFSLGYVGGVMYTCMYMRSIFYAQMMEAMNVTNTQLGTLTTYSSTTALLCVFFGPYLADKFDAKRVIVFSATAITAIEAVFMMFVNSFSIARFLWIAQSLSLAAYWPCLVKYINNMNSEAESGSSFGGYYLINGLCGALANVIPLWCMTQFGGGLRTAVFTMCLITGVAAILAAAFLDNEEKLAQRGIRLKGDEPIRLKYVVDVFKWPGTYMLAIVCFTTFTIYTHISYFNPYLIDVIGMDPTSSSALSIVRQYGAMVVAPLGGIMADKVFKSSSKWFICAFSLSAILLAVPLLFTPETNAGFVMVYSVIPSIVIFSLYSVSYSILRELHINPIVAGTAIGIATKAQTFSQMLLPPLFGSWLDRYGNGGYRYIFLLLVGNCIVGILNCFWIRSHDRKCLAGKRVMRIGAGTAEKTPTE